MNERVYRSLGRLFIVALTLVMVFFAYQIYSPGFGWKTIKDVLENAAKYIR
ncbi:MAG: hypothetical protein JST85_18930 [Acidobacteria bacterium]|nr:hypothetical protein [Acidobacteriota bacterium]